MELTAQEKVDLLWNRFVHRVDTYALQWYDPDRGGGYARQKMGDCTHTPSCRSKGKDCLDIRYKPLSKADIVKHLQGEVTIGTYAHDKNDTVKWLCLDMDIRKGETGDVQKLTMDVATFVAARLPKNSYRVEFSGNRGYHLWIFFGEPVAAAQAYALGRWIQQNVPHESEVGIEVYPKQTMIQRVGNPVKIPLGVHKKTGQRCLFVRGTFEPYEDQWEALTTVVPMMAIDLERLIETLQITVVDLQQPEYSENPNSFMTCMTRIMDEGLDEGIRDVGYFRLALFLKDRGLPFDATMAVMETVNMKSTAPFEALEEKAQSAFDGTYSVFPCYDPSFDSYCSSKCRYFPKKKKDRGNGDPRVIAQLSRD